MGLLTEIANAFLGLLYGLTLIYMYVVLGAVIISWVNADPYNPIVRILRNLTEPVLAPARRLLWPVTRQIQLDLSPILVIFGLIVLQIVIRRMQAMLGAGAF